MSMTSKQNLTEEIEFQAEQTKPRLTITDDMQPALYVGHKNRYKRQRSFEYERPR